MATTAESGTAGAGPPLLKSDRGAAAVEFALVMPLLIVLICGVIDFGRAYYAHITLTQAAREGARVLALTVGDEAQAAARTRAVAYGLEDTSTIGFEVDVQPDAACTFGELTNLVATYQYHYVTPISELLYLITQDDSLTSPITIRAKASMRCGG